VSDDAVADPAPAAVVVRPARRPDVPVIVELVRALAEFEMAADQVQLQEHSLQEALFGETPRVFAHVAERGGEVVGTAIWFLSYSTWTARPGIWLEDLFVTPAARGAGAGRALLAALARLAVQQGYTRLDWEVLDWNTAAIGFYRHLGAAAQDEWTVYRLSGRELQQLAAD
jgi:GNAT superfamily N-acetyltransferase